MSVQLPDEGGVDSAVPATADAAREFAAAVTATPEYQNFMRAQEALQQDAEARRLIHEFNAVRQRLGGGVFAGTAKDRAEYDKAEKAFSANPRVVELQAAQETLVGLLQELNQIISQEYGTDFARAAASGGGCCG